jgi:hypothetical protein
VVAALTVAAAVEPGAGRAATGSGGTRPAALWNAFPLRVEPQSVFTPPRATPVAKLPAGVPAPVVRADGSSSSGWIVGVLVLALLGATSATVLVLRGPAARWHRAAAAATSNARLGPTAVATAEQSYLLVVPGRLRSRVVERMGIPPFRGELIFDEELGRGGQAYVVEAIGASPLPNDRRPCAMLRRL